MARLGYPVTMPTAAWRESAACIDHDPRHWDLDHKPMWAEGMAICKTCPVRFDCLREHHGQFHAHGIYGGIVLEHGRPV